ncbi:MAG TPA: translocation/assembly module TamB domain-containing protein [Thermoanaerobaculia bacterium]
MSLFQNRPRLRRFLLWGSAALLVLALVLGASVWFLLGTQGGTEWLFTRLGALMPGELEVREIKGPLRGPLEIHGLVYKRDGLDMYVERVQLQWKLRDLLNRQLDIERLYADGVRIIPTPSKEKKEERGPLPDVNLRFNILVRDAQVRDLRIGAEADPFVIDRIDLATTAIGSRFRIDRFVVRSAMLDGDISGKFQPQGDYPVDLQVQWTVRPPDMAAFSGSGPVTGTLERLRVVQTLKSPTPAQLDTILVQPLYDMQFDGKLAFQGFNPRLVKVDLPDMPASGEVRLKGEIEAFTSTGTVRGRVEQAGGPVAVTYRLARDGERWQIDQADVTLPGTPTRLDARGLLTLKDEKNGGLDFQGQVDWRNLRWPLRGGETLVASSRGSASVSGSPDDYRADVQAQVSQAPGGKILPGRWVIEGRGDRDSFRFARLQGNLLGGRVGGQGEVAWTPQVRWNATLRGDGINPQTLSAEFPGRLSLTATSRGRLEEAGPFGEVQVSSLRGTLRGQPVTGIAGLRLQGRQQHLSRLDLKWGSATVKAAGRIAPTLDLGWNVNAPNLGIAVPQGGGTLAATGRVSGPTTTPRIQMDAQGEGLRFGETSLQTAALNADVNFAPGGQVVLDLRSSQVQSGERRLNELTVQGRGTRGNHTITAMAVNEEGRLDVALAGGLTGNFPGGGSWNGQIRRLDLRAERIGDWRLQGAAQLAASTEAVQVRGFCWGSGGARLCADGGWAKPGAWNVDSTIANFPLNTFKPFMPPDLEVTGNLNGKAVARGNGATVALLNVDLRPGPGQLRFPGSEGRMVAFRYEQGVVRAVAGAGGAGQATAGIVLVDVGSINANMRLPRLAPGVPLQSQPLAGRIDVALSNLAFVEGFVPDLDKPSGSLTGGYQLSGTIGSPRFVGRAQLQNGQADIPRFGLELRQIQLAAVGDGSGALAIDGSVKSGPGTLTLRGRAGVPSPETPVRLTLQGKRFQVSDTEEARALASPDLTFTSQGDKAELTGEVVIPEADISIQERKQGPVQASKDVVFVNQEADADPASKTALTARVRFVLGKDIELAAFGLKAKPTGSVLVVQRPGQVTRGTGQLEVKEGTFKAYGQDLTIERGRVIFAGPLNNAAVDLRAYRKADDGTVAGINAKGTLKEPEVTLWSNPTMTQTEQLSYLLMGRPLNRVEPQEGDRLANAATALGIRGGNMLAKKLAARFGLEEARIESDGSLDKASLVVSKYLSPKMYVSFGMGLFEPVNTFRIRYLLSDKWTLQAESGDETGADMLYTIERGGK